MKSWLEIARERYPWYRWEISSESFLRASTRYAFFFWSVQISHYASWPEKKNPLEILEHCAARISSVRKHDHRAMEWFILESPRGVSVNEDHGASNEEKRAG